MLFYSKFVLFLMILSTATACMIINCPRGGKRSTTPNGMLPIRNCARCGPNNAGHCYGPSICCAPEFGCLLATADTAPCQEEAASPDPCVDTNLGLKCQGGQGYCATNHICCTQTSCYSDPSCQSEASIGHKESMFDNIPLKNYIYTLLNAYVKSHKQSNAGYEQK